MLFRSFMSASRTVRRVSTTCTLHGGGGALFWRWHNNLLLMGRDPDGPNYPFILETDGELSALSQATLGKKDQDRIRTLVANPCSLPTPEDSVTVRQAYVEMKHLRMAGRIPIE
jgi:hypothetical protein